MHLSYDSRANSVFIYLADFDRSAITEVRVDNEFGLNLDLDAEKRLLPFELLDAAERAGGRLVLQHSDRRG